MRPVSLVTTGSPRGFGPGELFSESAEGDLVVAGAGMRRGEPCGVLADLVEPPLEVEQLEHLRVGADRRRSGTRVDQDAEVDLGGGDAKGVPVDEEPALG